MSKVPTYGAESFTCPYCGVVAHQSWFAVHPREVHPSALAQFAAAETNIVGSGQIAVSAVTMGLTLAGCAHCKQVSLWVGGQLCWPVSSLAPQPHVEMPNAVLGDYREAASILGLSPRGASALLRLCIQKLFAELGDAGDLNKTIAAYAAKGLNPHLVGAMDILRVVGNNAVHPGEMDITDDRETAGQLFELLNEIVDELISRPNRTARLYAKLPAGARAAIEQRDGGSKT